MAHPSTQMITIDVKNELCSLNVIAHCQSKDDDLRAQVLDTGSVLSWNFTARYGVGATVFWCNLAVRDKRLSFTAFNADNDKNDMYWVVRKEGVYTRIYGPAAKFQFGWRNGALSVSESYCYAGP
ncbi:unnamed protein product [Linum trigynum]|uniref:S-protein homolog n=1 Tax=Linum trigynum TaxID=586398 RepID=A0AAV2DQS4_9ROSI